MGNETIWFLSDIDTIAQLSKIYHIFSNSEQLFNFCCVLYSGKQSPPTSHSKISDISAF